MSIEKREYKVYSFDSASEDLKRKILDNYCDINVDDSHWYEYYDEWFKSDDSPLIMPGLSFLEFSFSGFSHQRQGASVKYEVDDTHSFARHLLKSCDSEWLKLYNRLVKWSEDTISINSTTEKAHYGHSYYQHYSALEFAFDYNPYNPGKVKELQDILNQESEKFHNNLCHEVFTKLDYYLNYLTSKEAIIETLLRNEYMFNENGRID